MTDARQNAHPWAHFFGGALGGMWGAVLTSPFDVVKTRLQSDLFRQKHAGVSVMGNASAVVMVAPRTTGLLYNFIETGGIIQTRHQFFTYGNGKRVIADKFNDGQENSAVYIAAAALAGIATGTATNPIWVVKTRLQLQVVQGDKKLLGGSWDCIKKIMREEGIRGFYTGLSASYLGVTEGTIQWVLYENLKKLSIDVAGQNEIFQFLGRLGSAGSAKLVATLVTYPHEVVRTRLRQPKVNGVLRYTGLWQTLRLVAEEGARALYSGLSAHLMRVVPNAVVMYSIYESVLAWSES